MLRSAKGLYGEPRQCQHVLTRECVNRQATVTTHEVRRSSIWLRGGEAGDSWHCWHGVSEFKTNKCLVAEKINVHFLQLFLMNFKIFLIMTVIQTEAVSLVIHIWILSTDQDLFFPKAPGITKQKILFWIYHQWSNNFYFILTDYHIFLICLITRSCLLYQYSNISYKCSDGNPFFIQYVHHLI